MNKKNKKTILFITVVVLCLAAIAIAQTSKISLKEVKDCKTLEWETENRLHDICHGESQKTICTDEPINESCSYETIPYEYVCNVRTETIQHSEEICTPKALEITKEIGDQVTEKGTINFKEWGKCSNEKEGNELIIICDSKLDGNNDGICQSGESCVKFVVTQNDVKRYLKNSQEDFTEEDPSFFLEELDYEVVSK